MRRPDRTADTDICDDRDGSRFVLEAVGSTAELAGKGGRLTAKGEVYRAEPGRIILILTEGPQALGGRGIFGRT